MKEKNQLYLDISFTSIGTLVPSLYKCVETHSIVVSATSHLHVNVFFMSETFVAKVVFWRTKQMEDTTGQFRALRRDIQKGSTQFLNLFLLDPSVLWASTVSTLFRNF
jgi:hypothetical protein